MTAPYIPPKKSLGQHFLKNPDVARTMVEAARLKKGDIVLEIGPGTGMLTEALLAAGTRVIAVEADIRAVDVLEERFEGAIASGALVLHHADVRDAEIASFVPEGAPYAIVANIPYYLSGMLIRSALESTRQPERMVYLVQKEVALRIARSKKETLLSLSVKAYGTPRYVDTVTRYHFTPRPGVDSAILAIDDISRTRFEVNGRKVDIPFFFTVLHAGFASRRKQLITNLSALFPRERLARHFAALGIAPYTRGEDLSIGEWFALVAALS
jgi:16S rRNA (adenine1518-N6/adenine1519-N6)-dimethyltransferase